METKTTNASYITPILCGGTFFTLLLQAGKQGLNERKKWATKSSTLSQGAVLEALIKIATPSYISSNDAIGFKSVVSDYKSCKIAKSNQLKLNDQAIISAFDSRIKTDYQKSVVAMDAFIEANLDAAVKGEWLVKALLELISSDQTIMSSDEFYIYADGSKCTKIFLAGLSKFCLPSFLLGIWHFIITKRKDNTIGRATYNSWHSAAVSVGAKRDFVSQIGETIQKQITLQPFIITDSAKTDEPETDDNDASTEDATATADPFVTTNNTGVQYQQNNYSQTFNVSGGTNTFNGFVINLPDKRKRMSNDLIKQPDGEMVEADTQPRIELSNTYNVSGGTNVFNGSVAQQTIVNAVTGTIARTVDASFCNIFVVKCKTFATSCFTMPRTKAHISGFDITRIYSFPSLFMKTNGGYCCCPSATQEFYWGFVTKIEDEGDAYRITYERRSACKLLQAQLNDVAVRLKITPIGPTDVLDQTGWRIYPLDIIKALTDSGFDMRGF